ncbi:VSP [Giardia lamblia P15]|uniref:VSP n=1 Tax=Giardia intestinalis (strain P15) TaxID=658858 RepID=E1F5Y9_GIAIA|nr:VSP [Giardia lamblia P15]
MDKQSKECKACSTAIPGYTACTYEDSIGGPKCSDYGSKTVRDELDGTTTCVDETECKKDKTHFYEASKCVQCGDNTKQGVQNCKLCTAKNTCETRVDGYKVNGNTCEACTGNCAECGTVGQIDTCTKCMPGYFLKSSSAKICVLCDAQTDRILGCTECTSDIGSLKCTKCKPNYKQSGEPGDLTCTKVCEDKTVCGDTAGACDAMIINSDGSALYYCSNCVGAGYGPINGKCTNTLVSNTCANGICTRCTNDYFLYMGGCYQATTQPGSYMCSTAPNGFCTTSVGQYFKIPGDVATHPSVLACGNPVGTIAGDKAYVLDCTACTAPQAPAVNAMAVAVCNTCDKTKKPNQDGSGCTLCTVAECKSCITDDVCEVCENSKKPNKACNACYACSIADCSHCSADNRCEVCADGGKRPSLDGTQCITCDIDRCTRCSAEDVCGECEAGYAPKDRKCEPGSTGLSLSTGAIAGIAVAVIIVVGGLVGFLCWWFICRGKA